MTITSPKIKFLLLKKIFYIKHYPSQTLDFCHFGYPAKLGVAQFWVYQKHHV